MEKDPALSWMGYGDSLGRDADDGCVYGWLELEPSMGSRAPGILWKWGSFFQETPLEPVEVRAGPGPSLSQAYAC